MSGYMKDKVAARKSAGKTTPVATTPIANAHANAVVLNKIENLTILFTMERA